jgi:DnaK suppressor protein
MPRKFQKLLEVELGRLSSHVRNIEESALQDSSVRETTGDLASYAEAGTDNFERETALNIATTESGRLRDINDALNRVENGAYGVCEGCEEEIPRKRLEVFPSARYCIKCQSKLEKEGAL